jgi:hypothetical protein
MGHPDFRWSGSLEGVEAKTDKDNDEIQGSFATLRMTKFSLRRTSKEPALLIELKENLLYTLNLKKRMSPSRTVYSLPSDLRRPFALTACSEP